MRRLRIGTGGIPLTSEQKTYPGGLAKLKELGLDHLEMEFVYGVRMNESAAKEIKEVNKKYGISLSAHGPYYINLASSENRIFYSSIKYISDTVYIAGLAGAKSITFHPGFYKNLSKTEAYQRIYSAFKKLFEEFDKNKFINHPINKGVLAIAPELTGKNSQFGDIDELIKLCSEFNNERLSLCIDFAHKFARSQGKYNNKDKFQEIIDNVKNNLGEEYLKNLHIHLSGIKFGKGGERNHVTLLSTFKEYKNFGIDIAEGESFFEKIIERNKNGGSDLNWKDLLKVLKTNNIGGILVCESPILELDALLIKQVYDNL